MYALRIVTMVLSLIMVSFMVSFMMIDKKTEIDINKKQKYIKLIVVFSFIVSILIIFLNIFSIVFK